MKDIRVRLSVLWLFATLNYIYADVFFCVDVLGSGKGGPSVLHFSPGAWLGIAILMEIPMAMVLLSRILKPRANRWANIAAGIIETAAVLLTSFILPAFHLTETSSYYLFFGAIEVVCTSLIVWYASRWPKETAPELTLPASALSLQQLSSPDRDNIFDKSQFNSLTFWIRLTFSVACSR